MSSSRTLRITVRGWLSDRVTAGFDGMTPVHHPGTTELVGRLVDQAQLHALLTRCRDLGLELESVRVEGGCQVTRPRPTTFGPEPADARAHQPSDAR